MDRDYFECHEILEEYWKENTDQQKNSIWVGFILLAVANYHHRRNNFSGASRTLEKAINILNHQIADINQLGFDEKNLFALLQCHLNRIKENKPYQSYSLPITVSKSQLEQCFTNNEISGMTWGKESNLTNESLIHRHKLRDRTDVITEREHALKHRKRKDTL